MSKSSISVSSNSIAWSALKIIKETESLIHGGAGVVAVIVDIKSLTKFLQNQLINHQTWSMSMSIKKEQANFPQNLLTNAF